MAITPRNDGWLVLRAKRYFRIRYLGISPWAYLAFWFRSALKNVVYWWIFVLPRRRHLRVTADMRGTRRGREAFVFATGGSLADLDPEKVERLRRQRGMEVIAISSYISSDFGRVVRPDYYLLSDPVFFGVNMGEIQQEKRRREVEQDIKRLAELGIPLFLPIEHLPAARAVFPDNTLLPFNDSYNLFRSNVDNLLKPPGYVASTANKALAAALYMGFSRIYVCGIDHDFVSHLTVDDDNALSYHSVHFYEEGASTTTRYRVAADKGEGRTVAEFLWSEHLSLKSLEKFRGQPVVNLARRGLVDAFPRKHDLDVYKEPGQRS